MFKTFSKTAICSFAIVFCLSAEANAQSCQIRSVEHQTSTQQARRSGENREPTSRQLEGDWNRSVGDNRSGADVAFSFDSNGRVKWELATISDGKRESSGQQGTFKVSGNTASLSYDDGGSDEFQFSIVGDVLTLSQNGTTIAVVDRIQSGKSRKQFSEIGEWKAEEKEDGEAFLAADVSMKKDGQFKMVIKQISRGKETVIEGKYRIENDQLIVESDEGVDRLPLKIGKSQLEIVFAGAKFTLTPNGNNSSITLGD